MNLITDYEVVLILSENPVDIKTARAVVMNDDQWMIIGWESSESFEETVWWKLCKRDLASENHLQDLAVQALNDHHIEIITVTGIQLTSLLKLFRGLRIAQQFMGV